VSAAAILVFARCAGFSFRAPGLSHPSVTPALRAVFAAMLTIATLPGIRAGPLQLPTVALLAAIATEFAIGSAIGMAAALVYDGAYAGGRAVDDYVGVKAIAPSLQIVAPSGFGRMWSLAYTGGFFLSGAYRPTILGFADGFERLPPGTPIHAHAWLAYAVGLAATILLVALAAAAPAIGLSFVVQIALGALSRAVPRFGSFTLTFPLAFAAALIATAIAVPAVAISALAPVMAIPGTP
jgi:flagellar biosynthetic protein FliR